MTALSETLTTLTLITLKVAIDLDGHFVFHDIINLSGRNSDNLNDIR